MAVVAVAPLMLQRVLLVLVEAVVAVLVQRLGLTQEMEHQTQVAVAEEALPMIDILVEEMVALV
jgi:hypothetical protein